MGAAGDMGLLVEFGPSYEPEVSNAVLAFDAALAAVRPKAVLETVPSFRSLLVRFDPLVLSFAEMEACLEALIAERDWYRAPPPESSRLWRLPAIYGGANGPDLGEVADMMGLREDQVIDGHVSRPLRVAMLGFSPGLPYLGQLPEIWDIPRRTTLNPRVPAGAVLVAVRQTVLPSTPIPTGWRQIGRTPFRSFDPRAEIPFLLMPGDEVQFEPVTAADFDRFDPMNCLVGGVE